MRFTTFLAVSGVVVSLGLAGCNLNDSVSAVSSGLNTAPDARLTALACDNSTVKSVSSALEGLSGLTTQNDQLNVFINTMSACNVKNKDVVSVAEQLLKEDLPKYKRLAQDLKDNKADKVEVATESAKLYANVKFLKDNLQQQQDRAQLTEQVKQAIISSSLAKGSSSSYNSALSKYDKELSTMNATASALSTLLGSYQSALNSLNGTTK